MFFYYLLLIPNYLQANFTPGPSQLYFSVKDHMIRAFRDGIPSLSHRTKEFESIFVNASTGLRELLGIPEHFQIVYASSATEIWERSIQNLVEESSLHFVNGAFSRRYHEIAQQLQKTATSVSVPDGQGFGTLTHAGNHELIAITQNETSTGVATPLSFINKFRESHPKSLIVVDAVSSLPYPSFDFDKIDSLFFSVQKGFGLPAGLGVWIVNDRCIDKAENLLARGTNIGTYHSLPSLISFSKKNQTPETPNVLALYLLSKVIADFLYRGIGTIRRETQYKAALLYNLLDDSSVAKPLVSSKHDRSQTVIVADCGDRLNHIVTSLKPKGLHPGDGYGSMKKTQLRFANFPAHSKEQYELLVDTLATLQ
jgi:phosphoserine aminotransferase